MSALSVPSSLLAMATVMPLVLPYGSQKPTMLYHEYKWRDEHHAEQDHPCGRHLEQAQEVASEDLEDIAH